MLSATARVQIPCDGRSLARVLANADAQRPSGGGCGSRSARPRAGPDHTVIGAVAEAVAGLMLERASALASIVSALRPLVAPLHCAGARRRRRGPAVRCSRPSALQFDNGIGGAECAGRLLPCWSTTDHLPPAPWANVIANAQGGFLVSERGAGCTWAENAYFFRLTPWHNDPVADPASDVLYLRTTDSGASGAPPRRRCDAERRVSGAARAPAARRSSMSTTASAPNCRWACRPDAAVKLSVLRVHERLEPATAPAPDGVRGMDARRAARGHAAPGADALRSPTQARCWRRITSTRRSPIGPRFSPRASRS